ncbi:YebG protein [Pseudomonas sessilinigenes]|uniref:YebG family protein n=1 Tax=Pseudomonas sessilinigenes TaxID=658629 RepID=A0ABX8MR16_9PSED|nr:YebG protein [Pseudomonas sessilinigenes]QIH06274.1 YebG family protein [Pseudomonas sp. BIOMIG1BAC]QXH41734.1 YebG family protein [Pseudomonas sessilinigenes]UMZ13065.1 YebG family protein [Pseudomonas sp. MPFS]
MAVEVVYRSSRDLERLFMDKAEADRHDKMLELAEVLAQVLQKAVPSLTEQQVEEAGIYMAKNRDVFARAFKSQPDALAELLSEPAPVVETVEKEQPAEAEAPVKPAKATKATK